MKIFWFQICLAVSALIGAIFVTHLSEKGLALFAGGALGICAVFGWVLTVQNRALKVRHGALWALLGHLQPIPSKWVEPLNLSWPARLLLVVAALLFGAITRLLWITHA
jgi:hypothetical protein